MSLFTIERELGGGDTCDTTQLELIIQNLYEHMIDGTVYTFHCCLPSPNCDALQCKIPVPFYLGSEANCQEICNRGTENIIRSGEPLGDCAHLPTGYFLC
jgi:hypothetical protein